MPDLINVPASRGHVTRIGAAGVVMMGVVLVGALGYHLLGAGRWQAAECMYMSVITISTVGFSETLIDLQAVPFARAWTVLLIAMGSGSMLYFASALTAFFVEGDLGGAVRRRRMQRSIDGLSGHAILCGAGTTGRNVLDGLGRVRRTVVVVDLSEEELATCRRDYQGQLYAVQGDATDDDTLLRAGIQRATGIVLALTEDRDNLYATVTARTLNPRLRIIVKAVSAGAEAKLRRAGADGVVSPAKLGGQRLAAQLVRPSVTDFFNQVVLGSEGGAGFDEVEVPVAGPQVGRSLGELHLREKIDVLVVGMLPPDGRWVARPGAGTRLVGGARLVVIGEPGQVQRLRDLLERG